MAHDVFISYSSHDKATADAICATLESRRIRCWIAPRDVLAGTDYAESIIRAIEECRIVVLVLSSNSNNSPQVKREIERAVSKGVSILTFKIEEVTLTKSMEFYVSSQHWLDALTRPLENHLNKLAETIECILKPEPPDKLEKVVQPIPPPQSVSHDKQRNNIFFLKSALIFAAVCVIALLIILAQPRHLELPDDTRIVSSVVGKTFLEARKIIEKQRLSVKKVEIYSNTVTRDMVISQNPAPQVKVKQGAEVTLEVSKGPEKAVDNAVVIPSVGNDAQKVKMPLVVNQSFAEAQKALCALGLKAKKVEVFSDTYAKGLVISQKPVENSVLSFGAIVTLKVSLGLKNKPSAASLQVKIWTDKPEYQEGDKIKIYITGNKPFYARVVYRDANGNIIQFMPNPYRENNYFSGDVVYELPSKSDRYEIEVTPPFGTETAILYASTAQLGPIDITDTDAGVYMVHNSLNEVAKRSRGAALKEKSGGAQSADQVAIAEFAEAQTSLKTIK